MKDLQIKHLIDSEKKRQKNVVNLIASENYVSKDILEALGSELTNKYAEGYPCKRYYGGQEFIDQIEALCIKRARELFNLVEKDWHVNVQPLSGSPANFAVYTALVPIRGKIMGMSLDHGGHLTHGHKASATGKFWTQISYGVDPKTEMLDYEKIKEIAVKEKPNIIVAGFTAYPRIIDWRKFREIADVSSALLMVDMSHIAGLVAGGVYPSPFHYADIVTTTTHKTLRGPRSAMIFAKKDNRGLDEKIDKAVFPGLQGGPHVNQIAAVAVALQEAHTPAFRKYIKQIIKNAKTLSSKLKKLGWRIVSGSTDTHLILLDTWLNGKGLGGLEASELLERSGIIVNKNTIPNEKRSAVDPSGIRLGTAAETTRGRKERDMLKIAEKIDKILRKE